MQPQHAPYMEYASGSVIHDHDVALAYVLEHYPGLLPSYAVLSPEAQQDVLFALGKMNFNHGWFVQAEGPPGGVLSAFKQAISSNASKKNIALYFLHWITDIAGGEPTPLAGAEKLVVKFPHSVFSSFLWSIPFLEQLAIDDETSVMER